MTDAPVDQFNGHIYDAKIMAHFRIMRVSLLLQCATLAMIAGLLHGGAAGAEQHADRIRSLFPQDRREYAFRLLPSDVQAVVRRIADNDDYLREDGSSRIDPAFLFQFSRFDAPRRVRSFLVVSYSGRLACGTAGCPTFLFERVDGRWVERHQLGANSIAALPLWRDGYPTLLVDDGLAAHNAFTIHWWQDGRYETVCVPPTRPICGMELSQGVRIDGRRR